MLKQKRNKLEIIKDLLGTIILNRNILKTKLMYKVNLDPISFKEYTQELIEKDLIKEKVINGKTNLAGEKKGRDRVIYNITERGREYLEDYRVVESFLEKYDLDEY